MGGLWRGAAGDGGGPVRILVVANNPATVQVLDRELAAQGHAVVATSNGEVAARLAAAGLVDIVLLDVTTPAFGGQSPLVRIRAARPDLPILVLTAPDDPANWAATLDAATDDDLTNPFVLDELLPRIQALTRSSTQPRNVTGR